jgi:hypothetical protein
MRLAPAADGRENRSCCPSSSVANPVEVIRKTQGRLARLAVERTALCALLPLAVTVALALAVEAISALAWDKFGYTIDAAHMAILREVTVALVLAEILVSAYFVWRAWATANDFVGAAQQIDDLIGGHQEILTLATLADPKRTDTKEKRTPLFPMLWRRGISYLDMFDPRREFKLTLGEPLKQSSILAIPVVVVLGLAMLALMHPPTPIQAVSLRLRELAKSLDTSPTTPGDHQLAEAARDVANDLENPKLPPEQKTAELQSLKQALEKLEKQKQSTQSGSGNSSGGSGNGNGNGQGQGTGKGSGGSGQGSGGGAGGKGKKSDQQMADLRNDISKAQIKLEEESNSGDKSKTAQQNNGEKGTGSAPKIGSNPNQAGPQSKPNGTGNLQSPQPVNLAQNKMPSGNNPSGRKDDKGSQGDTHLGEMPKATNYERFYKLGEKGPTLDIRDARYVTFRLPTEVAAKGGEGRTVRDSAHPTATTPYTNAPLKEQRLPVSPDEEQLVPPRYRDLIR